MAVENKLEIITFAFPVFTAKEALDVYSQGLTPDVGDMPGVEFDQLLGQIIKPKRPFFEKIWSINLPKFLDQRDQKTPQEHSLRKELFFFPSIA